MPTLKQKAAFKEITEKQRPVSVVMKEVGYSPVTAKKPKNLTESKGWKEMMNEYLPDGDLLEVHRQGLMAKRVITSHTEPDYEVEDHATRHKFLETAYKLKKYIGPESQVQVLNTGEMTLEFITKDASSTT